jgi:glutathione-regulated potassium-efflux system protein KefB
MKPARLWAMRREVFGLGSLQILFTGFAVAAYAALELESWKAALVVGMTFALSSTAFVMQLLRDSGETASRHGTTAFSVLLMQDMAIVPLLALIPILSDTGSLHAEVPLWEQVAIVTALVVLVWGFGSRVVPVVLDRLARQGNREGFFMVVMLAVFFAAWAMGQAGLSMALGAFMMGMLLSGSRYNLQIQALIEPYKGLLMSLFFVAVGMSINLEAIAAAPLVLAQHTLVVVVIKLVVMFLLGLAFHLPRQVLVRVTFLLAQGGEFGFVLLGSAKLLQVIDDTIFMQGVAVISVTMLLTPLLVRLGDSLARRLEPPLPVTDDIHYRPRDDEPQGRVIIGGYGRVGHTVATLLNGSGIPFIVFDPDASRVAQGRADGFPVFYGSIADPAILSAAHAENAKLVILTVDRTATALRAVKHIRARYPDLPVIARARDLKASGELLEAGATQAFPEAIESSMRLAANAMQMVGVAGESVDRLLRHVRSDNYDLVRPAERDG